MAGGRWLANAVPGDAAVRAAVLGSAVLGAAVDRRPTTDLRHAGLRAASRPAAAPAQAWSRRADPFGAERAAAHRAGRHDRAICQQEWPLPRREADGRRAGLDDLRSGQQDLQPGEGPAEGQGRSRNHEAGPERLAEPHRRAEAPEAGHQELHRPVGQGSPGPPLGEHGTGQRPRRSGGDRLRRGVQVPVLLSERARSAMTRLRPAGVMAHEAVVARRSGSAVTPGGGSPAVEASSAHQACRCAVRSPPRGVQDARISTSALAGGPASSPKRVDSVCVTVPPMAVCSAPWDSSASTSQLQPTAGSSAAAASAYEYGARRCGAGTSSRLISGRGDTGRRPATAQVNVSGVTVEGPMTEAYFENARAWVAPRRAPGLARVYRHRVAR